MKGIGKVKYLRRYPVKSMKGEDLEGVFISKSGLEGDRKYAFIDDNAQNKKFPWMTARQKHEMLLFEPRIIDIDSGMIEVKTPEGELFSIDDPRFEMFLEKRFGYSLTLKHDLDGCFDAKPISLFGLSTVRAIATEANVSDFMHQRFRSNIYAEWRNGEPFMEDRLVGMSLRLGEVVLKIEKKNVRCVIPTLDPRDVTQSPQVLTEIERNHGGCAGVLGTVVRQGTLKLNNVIELLETEKDETLS